MSNSREVRSNYVKVVKFDKNLFRVDLEGEELRTPGGNIVESDNDSFLIHMIGELEEYPTLQIVEGSIEEPRPLCAYLIFSTQLDFPGPLFKNCDLQRHLATDPIFNPSAGPEWTDQLRAWEPIASYLEGFSFGLRPWVSYSDEDRKRITEITRDELDDLDASEIAVFHNLYHLHGRSIIGPLAFLRAPLSIVEFANSVVASTPLHFTFSMPVDEDLSSEEVHKLCVQEAKSNARICKDYLSYLKPIVPPSAEEIWQVAEKVRSETSANGGLLLCPPLATKFIVQLVEDLKPESILDPWIALGTLAAPLHAELSPERFLGVYPNETIATKAQSLFPKQAGFDVKIGFGDSGEYTDQHFDLVVSCLPFQGPERDFEWEGQSHRVPLEVELAVRSTSCLTTGGRAAFIVPPGYFFQEQWDRGRGLLFEAGINELAAFYLPSGLFRPFTEIATYIILLERGDHKENLFVGEVTNNKDAKKRLLDNFHKGKSAKNPESGQFVEKAKFEGLPQLISQSKLEKQSKRIKIPHFWLDQIAVFQRYPGSDQKEFDGDNCFFIRVGVPPRCTVDSSEISESEIDKWVVVKCDKERADARVVAEFLTGPLGQLSLEASGVRWYATPIPLYTLADISVWLPPIAQQRTAIELDQKLQELEDTARSLRHDLWGRLDRLSEVQEKAESLNKEDALPVWLDTLPFPLASILWTYHTHKGDVQKRYSQLDFFFEGLTQFLAAILISGVKSDEESFRRAWPEVLKALAKAKLSLERATVGSWVTVFSSLAKVVRSELKDEDAAAHWQRQFACEQKPLLEALTSKKMSKLLQDANEFRNGWRGHGGIVGDDEAARRASLYYDLLLEFRSLVENRWRSYPLVIPENSKFKGGLNHYTVKRIVGSRTPFEKEKLVLKQQMEDGVMHLVSPSDGTACPLVPFIRLGASPADAENACYFFSKREGERVKYVSYHFAEKPEVHTEAIETQRFLEELLHET